MVSNVKTGCSLDILGILSDLNQSSWMNEKIVNIIDWIVYNQRILSLIKNYR